MTFQVPWELQYPYEMDIQLWLNVSGMQQLTAIPKLNFSCRIY